MMKKLLTFGTVGFLCGAFFDALLASGLDRTIPWLRIIASAIAGTFCFYLLIKYRREL
jgi:hypothetical protein